ncbi:MAG TPA: hypothetical protein VE010_01670 [Thermoanaerobaculia bacterium]|nr:hypothetical protein [Thermoanaerobaculia bacterium]
MRKLLLLCVVLSATAVFAQDERIVQAPPQLTNILAGYERRLGLLAKGISRDAFIVAQLSQAAGELHDFQRNAAIQKALDRVEEASKRAAANPPAQPRTVAAINKSREALEKAREQASSADLDAVSRLIVKETHAIQRELYWSLTVARRERETLMDLQKKISQLNLDLEGAMVDALGAALDFAKAGGN